MKEVIGKIKGIRTDCIDGEVVDVEMDYEVSINENRMLFNLVGGVTGYESFYIDDNLNNLKQMSKFGWCACVGTKGSWDRLVISPNEMKKVLDRLT